MCLIGAQTIEPSELLIHLNPNHLLEFNGGLFVYNSTNLMQYNRKAKATMPIYFLDNPYL